VELSGLACLALGTIFTGTCDGDVNSTVIQNLMERDEAALKDPFVKCMGLGVGLLFIGQQAAAEATVETLKVIESPIAKQIEILVECCAYAGTGNVLKIQKMLHHCNDHLDPEAVDPTYQSFAVLGIALIAMGEEIGTEMALRMFNHLVGGVVPCCIPGCRGGLLDIRLACSHFEHTLTHTHARTHTHAHTSRQMHYGEPVIKKTVPLAMALLCASHPLVHVLDLLSKYSHDHDMEIALSAIFAMGIVGAGTNNARLAQMLRQLAVYYSKDPNVLFVVRLAQGLVHMGKGTLSLSPMTFDRSLIVKSGLSGILTLLVLMTDAKSFILNKNHYLLYYLVTSMYPRMLLTLDPETLDLRPTTVRVGQAVHTVGQAGRPKTISGFQTHATPVLLSYSERAELASEEFLSCAAILEGLVVLEKNPEWEEALPTPTSK
jgi:26S proteasome regulatory subunit N1